MKKLLYIANLRLPTEKAYGVQIAKMCEAFASQVEVKLIYPNRINAIRENIFSYYSVKNIFNIKKLPAKDFYFPGQLDKIAVAIKNYLSAKALIGEALKENADVYYTRDELAAYLLSKKKNNVIFECHRFSNKRKIFYSHFKKVNLKIVAISEGLKEDLVKFGIKDSNILVARDGVDLEEFKVSINKEEARKRFFHQNYEYKKIAVYIGHLYPWKGANVLIETADHLRKINENYLICIFGGTDKDIKEFKLNLSPSLAPFLHLKGMIPHREIATVLKAADSAILIGEESDLVSAKYTSPLKMFEYMASGCPIVAQDLPSFREVLSDENSFLVEPGNAKALADKIAWVFDEKNEETAKNKAAKAFEDVQEYTWQKRAEKILNFTK